MSADEVWQAYNLQGEQTGPLTKFEAQHGALHGAAHIWIWRERAGNIEILLQRRSLQKSTWGGMLDISAAGHINHQETPLLAVVRETSENLR